MHPFFEIVERAGINQARLAGRMRISRALFTLVKQGRRQASPAFRQAGTAELAAAGVWHRDGRPYRVEELFHADADTIVSTSDSLVTEVA